MLFLGILWSVVWNTLHTHALQGSRIGETCIVSRNGELWFHRDCPLKCIQFIKHVH